MQVLEWGGVPLSERSFEEVCSVVEHGGDSVEILVTSPPPDEHTPMQSSQQHPPQLLFGNSLHLKLVYFYFSLILFYFTYSFHIFELRKSLGTA